MEQSEFLDYLKSFAIAMKNKGHDKTIQKLGLYNFVDMVLDEVYKN